MTKLLNYHQMLIHAEFLNSEAQRLFQTNQFHTGMCVLLKAQSLLDQLQNVYDNDRRN